MDLDQYISDIKKKLNESLIVSSIEIVDERVLFDRGYFRATLTLINEDFLEIAESFTVRDEQLITLDYRYQWMDNTKQTLRKRWDSVKHFPDLPNFPHHVHVGAESNVEPGQSRSITEFIEHLENELG
jgi:hypothetical protein